MTTGATFSIRLDEGTRRELDAYAKAMRRSSAFIVKEAVEAHLAERRAYLAAVDEALVEVDQGQTVAGQDVFDWLKTWGQPHERVSKAADFPSDKQ